MGQPNVARIGREAARIMGPAFLVSVAYMDPGNWATAIEAGSRFGYQLVWVVVLSNLIAILLQTLAARLGLVTGKHLAQVCREAYPPLVCYLLWVLCEISIVALDLTMVLGTAIGLNLLLGWPMLPCILLTGLDALLLLLLVPSRGVRTSEQLTVGLLVMVVCCFLVDLLLSKPPLMSVVGGLVPRLSRESVYAAVCLLGANVMPHNFYLHSALVAGQARGAASTSLRQLCLYNFIDIAAALGLALVVNVAVLLVAAATFHQAGIVVETLQSAHDLMETILSSSAAPAAFGLALLCAGQLSTFTGTIAGQVVLRGFLNVHISTWLRRVATRSAAVLPAALLQYMWGDKATYRYLLVAQVVLALQLPFTLVPLIKATSSARLMGCHRNSRAIAGAAWASLGLVFVANAGLFVAELWPGAAWVPQVTPGGPDSPLHQYLDNVAGLAWARPGQFLLVLGLLVAAAALLALQLWIIITPLSHTSTATPLLLTQTATASSQQPWEYDRRAAAGGGSADKGAAVVVAWGHTGTAAAAAEGFGGRGLGGRSGSSSRHVVVGWGVPGVREWLLGSQAPGDEGTHVQHGLPDIAAGWSGDIQLAAHSRLPAAHLHPGLTTAHIFSEQQQPLMLIEQAAAAAEDKEAELQAGVTDSSSGLAVHRVQPDTSDRQQQGHQAESSKLLPSYEGTAAAAAAMDVDAGSAGLLPLRPPQQQQQQQQQQAAVPLDSWDDADIDSFTLLPCPSSPAGGSEASTSLSALGADREVWLDSWPEARPGHMATPPHRRSSPPPSPPSPSYMSVASCTSSSASSMSTAHVASLQQQRRQWGAVAAAGSRGVAVPPAASSSSLHSLARSADTSTAAAAAGSSVSSNMGKSGRRAFAAALDSFWSAHYDTHGHLITTAAAAAARGSHQQQQQLQQQRKRQQSSPEGQQQRGTVQQSSRTSGSCCRCGVAGSGSSWCYGCSMSLLIHMQQCLGELLAVPGGADVATHSALTGQTAGGEAGATTAASLLLGDVCSQLPATLLQQLRVVVPAAANGVLLEMITSSSLPPKQCNSSSDSLGADHHQQQQQQERKTTMSRDSLAAAEAGCAAAPVVLCCWGVWCIMQLLVLAQVEVRPELWGRYAAVLNRLQGCLADIITPTTQQAAGWHSSGRTAAGVPGGTTVTGAAPGDAQLPLCVGSAAERDQLVQVLLVLLQQLEGVVTGRAAPPGAGGGVGAAFGKGKEICMSVVKRYRRRLSGSSGSTQQAQQWSSGGGSAASRQRPSSSGHPVQQRLMLGVLVGGLVVMPLMLAASCAMGSAAVGGCTRGMWQQRQPAVLMLRL